MLILEPVLVKEETLNKLYTEILEGIASPYKKGGLDYLKAEHPQIYKQIFQAEDTLNQIWNHAERGNATLSDFKEALQQYYDLQIKGIELYKNPLKPMFSSELVSKESQRNNL